MPPQTGTCLCTDLPGSLFILVPTSPASFPALRVCPFRPIPRTPGSRSRPTDRGPAEGGQRQRSNRRAVTGPTGGSASLRPPRLRPGASRGRCICGGCVEPGAGFGIARLPASPRESARCVEVSSPAVRGFEPVSLCTERRVAPPGVEGLRFFSMGLREMCHSSVSVAQSVSAFGC